MKTKHVKKEINAEDKKNELEEERKLDETYVGQEKDKRIGEI